VGVILADIAVAVINWSSGIDQPLRLGGAGMLDAGRAVAAAVATAQPIARISGGGTWALGQSLTLDGSGSTVPSGRSLSSYDWAITSGAGLAHIVSASNAASVNLTTDAVGSVTVQLTVTDDEGDSGSASTVLNIVGSVAPTAQLTASAQTVVAGDSVSFDGSGSAAVIGRVITGYAWTLTSGGDIAALTDGGNGPTVTVTTRGAGSFTLQLTVTDSAGAQATRSATVTVTAASGGGRNSGGGSGGGGGGATDLVWLLGLALAGLGFTRRRR
jgi:serine protease